MTKEDFAREIASWYTLRYKEPFPSEDLEEVTDLAEYLLTQLDLLSE